MCMGSKLTLDQAGRRDYTLKFTETKATTDGGSPDNPNPNEGMASLTHLETVHMLTEMNRK